MKTTIILLLSFVAGCICCGCVSTREMPDSQQLEYKAGGQSRVYHNDSRKDYTGIDLSMTFTQKW